MAAKMIFTWNLNIEAFKRIQEQPNLLDLRREFEMRRYSLSRSLLIWEKPTQDNNWSLSDIGNKKFYHIVKRSDTEIEVLEDDWSSVTRRIPPFTPFDPTVHGTHDGFVDWLMLSGPKESDLEELKRTDLSERKLDFEIVHDDLLAVHKLFWEILTAPREWLVGLSNDDIRKIGKYLKGLYKAIDPIWDITLSTPRETHTEVLQGIFQFCDEVKRQLQQTVTYLRSKKVGQLDAQASKQLETQVKSIADKVLESFTAENNQSHESTKQDVEQVQEELGQLTTKIENEIAKETVSKHSQIFKEQAGEHQRASKKWLMATSGLIVAFGGVFYWLFETLRLGGTEWVGVLQNVFTKGFLLTLIYLVLNRSIKNYTAQKHLEVVNRHRQNALDTFEDFLDASDDQETRNAVLLTATNAIFDANQSGYLSTKMKGTESVNPLQQVIRAVLPGTSPTKPEN